MSEQNKQVVREFIEAMGRGDRPAADKLITDDAFTLAMGYSKFAGVRERETILATIAGFRELMPEGMQPEILSMTAEEDRVVAEFKGNGTLVNGEAYCNEYCMVFMLRDGKIAQVREYFCTVLAERVLLPLFEAAGL
ncbi:nuclear transport factor 2 family protein [Haliea sp. E17]|uniref:nuclear transport factor 2 family protein n=1 Tax=Haliea sp. E17 TaxID=3401576 RepID=UPI003AAC673F